MLKLLDIRTQQVTAGAISVSWYMESSTEDFNNYRLTVYQARARAADLAEYDIVASGINPAITLSVLDTSMAGITSKWMDFYYRIMISGVSGQGIFISAPYGISYTWDKYAAEIVRRREIVLQLHSAQTYHLLKLKHFGTLCPDCYDPTLQRVTESKCLTCYGTGYVGGYYNPIEVRGQINQRPTREMHQLFGAWQDQDAVLYTQAIESVNPKDIVIDSVFTRWIVLNVGSNQKGSHPIGQIAQLRQLERDDIVYQFPVS
jgi:hypothetical protein